MSETATYVETDCTLEHEGRTFESGGAIVTDQHIVAYPNTNGVLSDWHGNPIGTWWSVARWPIVSHLASYMHQIEATVDGVTYTGRGLGLNMLYRGKRKANQ